jgi:hypothetical protein
MAGGRRTALAAARIAQTQITPRLRAAIIENYHLGEAGFSGFILVRTAAKGNLECGCAKMPTFRLLRVGGTRPQWLFTSVHGGGAAGGDGRRERSTESVDSLLLLRIRTTQFVGADYAGHAGSDGILSSDRWKNNCGVQVDDDAMRREKVSRATGISGSI